MHTFILANQKTLFTHGFQTLLIIGIIAILFGILFGWYLWRRCKADAEKLIAANARLERDLQGINSEITTLEKQIQEFEKAA